MQKNNKNTKNEKIARNQKRVFGTDRKRLNRMARVMAILMILLMLAFTFISAGMFLLN